MDSKLQKNVFLNRDLKKLNIFCHINWNITTRLVWHENILTMQAAFPLTSTEAVSLHYCAGDVKLFEGCHTQRAPQVIGRPDESIRSCNGDSRFTGRQDHHYSFDVWDGETRVLSETPDTHTQKKRGGRRYRTGQHQCYWFIADSFDVSVLVSFWFFDVVFTNSNQNNTKILFLLGRNCFLVLWDLRNAVETTWTDKNCVENKCKYFFTRLNIHDKINIKQS